MLRVEQHSWLPGTGESTPTYSYTVHTQVESDLYWTVAYFHSTPRPVISVISHVAVHAWKPRPDGHKLDAILDSMVR